VVIGHECRRISRRRLASSKPQKNGKNSACHHFCLARCIRRVARQAVASGFGATISDFRKAIKSDGLEKLLGRRKYKNDVMFREARVGVWTLPHLVYTVKRL